MNPLLSYYKQTWWLWLIFVLLFAWLAYKVMFLFVLMVPGIIAYSAYFGIVRTSELAEAEAEAQRRRGFDPSNKDRGQPASPGSTPQS